MKRAFRAGILCGVVSISSADCTNATTARDAGASTAAGSLTGTWDLATTTGASASGGDAVMTTLVVGDNSLTVTSPDFTLTATRTGNTLAFTDEQTPGNPGNDVTLTATQTAAAFDSGVLPFDLGGSWTMQIVPAGQSTVMTCSLTVSASEIDGSCQQPGPNPFDFSFTTTKTAADTSIFGDFGGTWMNTWTWPEQGGGTFPCQIAFTGSSIQTCTGGGANDLVTASPIAGISFTYDGTNTASGTAYGWAEFSATRR